MKHGANEKEQMKRNIIYIEINSIECKTMVGQNEAKPSMELLASG